ncbi:MAG: hypothetical protein AAFO82_22045 [Bacteroidota bacterium]
MTKKDTEYLKALEESIKENSSLYSFKDLNGFPFSTMNQLREAVDNNEITLGTEQDFTSIKTYGKPSDHPAFNIAVFLFIAIPISLIIYSIITKEWIFLAGIPLGLSGIFFSNPSCQFKGIIGLALLAFILSFFFLEFKYRVLLGAFIGGIYFAQIARNQTVNAIINFAKESETLFVYLFAIRKSLVIKDNKANRFLNPSDYV